MKRSAIALLAALTILITLGCGATEPPTSTPPAPTPPVENDWHVRHSRDPITGADTTTAKAFPHSRPQYATLSGPVVRCDAGREHGVEVFFIFDLYMWDAYPVVTYRVDGGMPVTQTVWRTSTNNRGAFVVDRHLARVLSDWADASLLVFRAEGYEISARTYTYEVHVQGLRDALADMGCYTGPL